MPGTMTQSQIMQPTGHFHHDVTDRASPVAQFLLDDAASLHTAHRMLYPHLLACNALVLCFLLRCRLTTAWLLCRLLDRYVLDRKSLKSHVLIQNTSSWQVIQLIIHY